MAKITVFVAVAAGFLLLSLADARPGPESERPSPGPDVDRLALLKKRVDELYRSLRTYVEFLLAGGFNLPEERWPTIKP